LFLEHIAFNNLLVSVALAGKWGLSVLTSKLDITMLVLRDSSFIWEPRFPMPSATCLGDKFIKSSVPTWSTIDSGSLRLSVLCCHIQPTNQSEHLFKHDKMYSIADVVVQLSYYPIVSIYYKIQNIKY
jgi:hypothetical protein